MSYIQMGAVGAMQRCAPALTELFLQWTGIPGAERLTFNVSDLRTRVFEEGVDPPAHLGIVTEISVPASSPETARHLSDFIELSSDAAQRRSPSMMTFDAHDPAHDAWWRNLAAHDEEFVSPVEWWWRLLVLRSRGVRTASSRLLFALFGDLEELTGHLVHFVNPSLNTGARTAEESIGPDGYHLPTHLDLTLPHGKVTTVDLDDALSARLSKVLIQIATSDDEEAE